MKLRGLLLAFLLCIVGSAAEIPRQAPDFSMTLPNGKPVKLSDYRGKVVVLAFILTT